MPLVSGTVDSAKTRAQRANIKLPPAEAWLIAEERGEHRCAQLLD